MNHYKNEINTVLSLLPSNMYRHLAVVNLFWYEAPF